jgi:hypothetical protein
MKDKLDPTGLRRFLLPIKNNLAGDTAGLAYMLDATWSKTRVPVVRWEADPVNISADDALRIERPQDGEPTELDEAKDWLRDALADGPRPAKEMLAMAKKDGLSKRTLDRARADLGVRASKKDVAGGWKWNLPGAPAAQDCQEPGHKNTGNLGNLGNLGQNPAETHTHSLSNLALEPKVATFGETGEVGNLGEPEA